MRLRNCITTLLLGISLISSGCGSQSNAIASEEKQTQIRANLSEMLQISTTDAIEASTAIASESTTSGVKETVVGTWRFEHPLPGTPLQCISEQIFQSSGAYSGMTQCGPYADRRTGKWTLPDSSTIRVSLNDGQLIRWDSWKFKMLDKNRMALGDGRVIAYRVN